MAIEIPTTVVNKARAVGAGRWLSALPGLIGELTDRWDLTVGPPYPDGTEAWVAPADRGDGTEAVLKVCVPRPGDAARREALVLELARRRGSVGLLAFDEDREALLLERLGPSLNSLALPVEWRHRILAATAPAMWRPASAIDDRDRSCLMAGDEKARWLIEAVHRLWEALDRPCSEAAVDHAVACAEARAAAHDPERSVLAHGDVHEWNTLRSGEGWKLIDPDGLVAEPASDLGIIMREDPVELGRDLDRGDARRRSRALAASSGCEETAIWEWGVVERVSTGLLCAEIGLEPVGRQMLDVADRVAGLGR